MAFDIKSVAERAAHPHFVERGLCDVKCHAHRLGTLSLEQFLSMPAKGQFFDLHRIVPDFQRVNDVRFVPVQPIRLGARVVSVFQELQFSHISGCVAEKLRVANESYPPRLILLHDEWPIDTPCFRAFRRLSQVGHQRCGDG